MRNLSSAFFRVEKYFFLLVVVLHAIPLFYVRYFVTHDGPGHLYNSNLINLLLFREGTAASVLFEFTPGLVPNWIGHVLLSIFNFFFQAPVAEKIFQLLYVVAFPYSFRLLVKSTGGNEIGSWLAFPFIYSFTFHIGFYSFSIGLCLLFLTLAYWWKQAPVMQARQAIILAVLLMILYLCHLFIFFSAFCCILFFYFWNEWSIGNRMLPAIKKSFFQKQFVVFLIASCIPLLLTVGFILGNSNASRLEMPVFKHVIEWYTDVRPIVTLDYDKDKALSKPLFFVYMIVFLFALIERTGQGRRNKTGFMRMDGWLILSVILALLFFFVPDNLISGGIIGIRFCLLSYMFMFLFMAAYSHKLALISGGIISVMVSLLMISKRMESIAGLSKASESYASCASLIPEGSTLVTLNYSDNWMFNNIAAYMGSEKEIMVLDNYEASQVHFPLKWKEDMDPNKIIGTFALSKRPCVDLSAYKRLVQVDVDYVLVMEKRVGIEDSCYLGIQKQLAEGYKLVYTIAGSYGELYERIK